MKPKQRKWKDPSTQSIAERAWNGLRDALGITTPPTYTDGYGNTRNAEVPFWEGAQGQELKRMGETAKTAGQIGLAGAGLINPFTASSIGTTLLGTLGNAYGLSLGAQNVYNTTKIAIQDPSSVSVPEYIFAGLDAIPFGLGASRFIKGLSQTQIPDINIPKYYKNIPIDNNAGYRIVTKKEAIDDANNLGIIRGKNEYMQPYYTFGKIFGKPHKTDYIIQTNGQFGKVGPHLRYIDYNYSIPSVGDEVTTIKDGIPILPTTQNSSYWKRTPILGWRKYNFQNNFNTELNWSPLDWFNTRAMKTFTKDDVKALNSHLPEYIDIEKSSKQDGSFLNYQGIKWNADPRAWVQLNSNAAKRYLSTSKLGNDIYMHTSPAKFDQFSYNYFGQNDGGYHGKGFYLSPIRKNDNGSFYKINSRIGSIPFTGKYGMAPGINNNYMFIVNSQKPGYKLPIGEGEDIVKLGYDAHIPYDFETVITKPTQVKSVYGNNGNFDINDSNFYHKNGGIINGDDKTRN